MNDHVSDSLDAQAFVVFRKTDTGTVTIEMDSDDVAALRRVIARERALGEGDRPHPHPTSWTLEMVNGKWRITTRNRYNTVLYKAFAPPSIARVLHDLFEAGMGFEPYPGDDAESLPPSLLRRLQHERGGER